jgi:Ca-activated chloride channel family protein
MFKKNGIYLFFFIVLLFSASFLPAQGLMIPERPVQRIDFRYPEIKSQTVDVQITDQAAVTTVQQIFYNPNRFPMEAEYIFVLPENSVATELSMWMNGKKIKGELLDSNRARQIYQSIVSRMKDPALLEYMGRNLFRAKIFPVPAAAAGKLGNSRIQVPTSI